MPLVVYLCLSILKRTTCERRDFASFSARASPPRLYERVCCPHNPRLLRGEGKHQERGVPPRLVCFLQSFLRPWQTHCLLLVLAQPAVSLSGTRWRSEPAGDRAQGTTPLCWLWVPRSGTCPHRAAGGRCSPPKGRTTAKGFWPWQEVKSPQPKMLLAGLWQMFLEHQFGRLAYAKHNKPTPPLREVGIEVGM